MDPNFQEGRDMRTLPAQLLSIREIGHADLAYWTPASEDGFQLSLEPGERPLWATRCRVSCLRPQRWALPDDTTVVVTDRRIAFLTTGFDKGGGRVGFGVASLAVAVTANAVSKQRAKKRSAGKVAIGQLRHEWVTTVALRKVKPLIGPADTYLDIVVATNEGPSTIQLWGRAVSGGELARWLAATIAWHRLTLATDLSTADRGVLERQTEASRGETLAGVSDATTWQIPGDVEQLIHVANERFLQQAGLPATQRTIGMP
jgi:hypothetical protein